VALHEGRPHVEAGAIVVWHRSCWDARDIPAFPLARYALVQPPRASERFVRGVFAAVVASAIVSMGIAQWSWAEIAPPPPQTVAQLDVFVPESLPSRVVVDSPEAEVERAAIVETEREAKHPIPVEHGRLLNEAFPTLHEWVHPVTNAPEYVPREQARQFGEPRIAIKVPRPDCGMGHCGIDLDGPEGRPIAAVASGVVVGIDRSELGADGMSGRFVRLRHDDGTLTSYMHLDDIADGLEVGDRVAGGQFVGTLGSTACFSAPAHLHFALEIPNHPGDHEDTSDTHFVDPSPFLVRATIVKTATFRRIARNDRPAM
jgi:murein DD-endopeptidase MepM/ murein hydrolase activator NlpD